MVVAAASSAEVEQAVDAAFESTVWPLTIILGIVAVVLILAHLADYFEARSSPTARVPKAPRKSDHPIGYKYANISKRGRFIGLSKGKPYGVDSAVAQDAMGFHSYKSIELLQHNTRDAPQNHRGALILEVLHYGDVTEYEDGYVSTKQRVLQVAPGDSLCLGGDKEESYCSNEVEFVYILGKDTVKLCRPHYAGSWRFLRLVPGRKIVPLQHWLKEFAKAEDAEKVVVSPRLSELKPSR